MSSEAVAASYGMSSSLHEAVAALLHGMSSLHRQRQLQPSCMEHHHCLRHLCRHHPCLCLLSFHINGVVWNMVFHCSMVNTTPRADDSSFAGGGLRRLDPGVGVLFSIVTVIAFLDRKGCHCSTEALASEVHQSVMMFSQWYLEIMNWRSPPSSCLALLIRSLPIS